MVNVPTFPSLFSSSSSDSRATESRTRRSFSCRPALAVLVILVVAAAPLLAKPPGDYHVGETVESDIVTPVVLHVVDAAATAELHAQAAAQVPGIFKFDPAAADAAERELRESFARTRRQFQQQVQAVYQRRTLAATNLSRTRFQQLAAAFANTNRDFPLTTNLAELWATGDTGRAVQNAALAKLRSQQELPLRPDALPPVAQSSPRALLVTVSSANESLTLEAAQQHGRTVASTNLIALAPARTELTGQFAGDERPIGKFAAGLLRENCYFAADLTERARQRSTANLLAADRFNTGQVIAKQGQVVDAHLKTILDELQDKTAATQLAARVSAEQVRADRLKAEAEKIQITANESRALATTALASEERIRQRNQWLVSGLVVTTTGVGLLSWRLLRRKRPGALLPARLVGDGVPATVVSCPSCDETIVIPTGTASATDIAWQQRARVAERRAAQAQAALRAGALAQLGLWLKQSFAQRLLSERSQMLDVQQSAAAELAELEQRLDELHAPLQERLRAYEKRVAELEKALAAKGQENRQLLEAKIQLTRKQMATERARTEVQFN